MMLRNSKSRMQAQKTRNDSWSHEFLFVSSVQYKNRFGDLPVEDKDDIYMMKYKK